MPRDASGNYTLPAGNPVVTETLITSVWANTTMSDLGTEVTDSISRSGKGGMLAVLKLADQGFTFTSEQNTIFRREGSGDIRASVLGKDILFLSNNNVAGIGAVPSQWFGNAYALQVGAAGSVSNDNNLTGLSRNVFNDGAEKRIAEAHAARVAVNFDGTISLRVADSGIVNSAITWKEAVTVINNTWVGMGTTTPQSLLHLRDKDLGVSSSMYSGLYGYLTIESEDARLGLFSENEGGHGSSVVMAESNAGVYQDAWVVGRASSGSGSALYMYYGTNPDYPSTDRVVHITTTQKFIMPTSAGAVGLGRGYDAGSPRIPDAKLHIRQNGDTNNQGIKIENTAADATLAFWAGPNNPLIETLTNHALELRANSSATENDDQLYLSANGNVGVGTKPKARATNTQAIQLFTTGYIYNSGVSSAFGKNYYFDGQEKRIAASATCERITLGGGNNSIEFELAVAGAADSVIASWTKPLELKANGNIAFGTYVAGASAVTGHIVIEDSTGTPRKLGVVA